MLDAIKAADLPHQLLHPTVVLALPEDASAVRLARAAVRGAAHPMLSAPRLADAVLLTSELVTNALLYAGPPVAVHIHAESHRVSVAVGDHTPPARIDRSPLTTASVGGRGLAIVASLANVCGLYAPVGATGKFVWFVVEDDSPSRDVPTNRS
ncbi:ATP-binding protein [Jatrophihabitans telluris]|uniref:ATP-binding protein n=1 Tax=Jatrophihabitans telluris TaxID=2038343 RepID=A0ABY4QZM6_9ACTN|nr:ATP-binding protein [Jatrophihabitans telluris]UQX89015.1 ATP-binding protein [Jatrophihabitans telluris]